MSQRSTTGSQKDLLIFLVDDEPILLDMAEVALLPEGYELRRFENPEAALAAFNQEKSKPALLLTDYAMDAMDAMNAMNAMNGIELSVKCKASHPGLKILS